MTGILAASVITWAVAIKSSLTTTRANCDGANGKVNGLDDFFRTSLKVDSPSTVGAVSDVLAYGVTPLAGIGINIVVPMYDGRGDEAFENILLVAEAGLTFTVLQQGLAALVPRERPAVHAAPAAERDRLLESRLAPLVWLTGGALAVAVSYLRMAADRHYFTDVISGAALGVGTGIAVPLLFHRPVGERPSAVARWLQRTTVSTTEVPGGRIVALAGRF